LLLLSILATDELMRLFQLREQELIDSIKSRDRRLQELTASSKRWASIDDVMNERNTLSDTVIVLRRQLEGLQSELKQREDDLAKCKEEINELRTALRNANDGQGSVKQEIMELDKENQELERLCKSLEREKTLYLEQVRVISLFSMIPEVY
jgi:chromosome segregation ATPase